MLSRFATFFMFITLGIMATAFTPFSSHCIAEHGPWFPFTEHNNGSDDEYKRLFGIRISPDMKGKQLEGAAETIKHKCFKACHQRRAGEMVPPSTTTIPNPPHDHIHPAHTCTKEGHSCMRNIVSFKKLPGRTTFRRSNPRVGPVCGRTQIRQIWLA